MRDSGSSGSGGRSLAGPARDLVGAARDAALAFWRAQLTGAPPALELPTDHPRSATRHARRDSLPLEGVEAGDAPRLLAAFRLVLSRWSGQRDLVVGVALDGDDGPVPVRTVLEDGTTFTSAVEGLVRGAEAARPHRDLSLAEIVEALGAARDPARHPIFQAMFAAGRGARELVHERAVDLAVVIENDGVSLAYDAGLFERSTIERFGGHVRTLLSAATMAPETPVANLPLLGDDERHTLLVAWNATERDIPSHATAFELFEATVARTPDAIAVEFQGRTVTYRELHTRALRVAAWLAARGVRHEGRVAVEVNRSEDMIAALLGVMRAGAAYVPIDPRFPEERRAFMRADAGTDATLTDAALAEALAAKLETVPAKTARPGDVAYILYTSGSTGKPKGVMVTHGSVVSLLWSMTEHPGLQASDVLLAVTTLSFDISGVELYLPLTVGAKVVVASRDDAADPASLGALLRESEATLIGATPATFTMLVASGWRPSERLRIFCAGEAIAPELASALATGSAGLWNLYGPTETTIYSTGTLLRANERVTIGGPLGNTRAYILDENLDLAPIGVVGELHLAGAGVARGYHGRAELTAEKFLPDPFALVPGERMYRTGDVARWLPNGDIDCLGRIDHQVKVRGFRIELGEIEAALTGCAGVTAAAATVRDKALVGYVVLAAGEKLSAAAVQDQLRRTLPDYMVPSFIVSLDTFPLTPSGKIDRKALPAPDLSKIEVDYVAPRNPIEEKLAAVFADVLGLERIGVHTDFFALGGHSLLATRAVNRIRTLLGVDVSVRALFDDRTVARVAVRVGGSTQADDVALTRVDRARPTPASFAQARLWFLDRLEGPNATYNVPYGVRLVGDLDVEALERALNVVIAHHEALRTTFEEIDGVAHQKIRPEVTISLERFDARSEEEARGWIAREVARPFDLARGPLVRAALARLGDGEHLFTWVIHHIATDGWSNDLVNRDLSRFYDAIRLGHALPAAAPQLEYADFSSWERRWLAGDRVAEQVAFWRQHLGGAPAALELPTDRPRPPHKQYEGDAVSVVVPEATTRALRALCKESGATPFMVLLTAFQALLSRWSGQSDVVVGTPTANRTREELEGIVGFFVNTLALRSSFDEHVSFADAVERTKAAALAAYAHQDLPFDRLVEELRVPRDTSRNPVFQAMFTLENGDPALLDLPGLVVSPEPARGLPELFDVSLLLTEERGSFRGSVSFDVALFDHDSMARFAGHFVTLLTAAVNAAATPVALLPLVGDEERRTLLASWSGPDRDVEQGSVHEWFERCAKATPDAPAIVTESETITYAELNHRANRLARLLQRRGVRRGDRVATWFKRSPSMIVAELATLKATAAYVPLDPTYPVERIDYTVADIEARVVLSSVELGTTDFGGRLLAIDAPDVQRELEEQPADDLRLPYSDSDAACVIYTSGTTGRPKGCVLEHRSFANLIATHHALGALTPSDRGTQLFGPAFDAHIDEIWSMLSIGASLYFVTDELRGSPEALLAWLARHEITVLAMPTALAVTVLDGDWSRTRVRRFFLGSEALRRRPRPGSPFAFINVYGPTETTGYVTSEVVEPGDHPLTTIGGAIQNTAIYIFDRAGGLAPIGVFGEIHVGGANVGRGYFGRPDLTAERFVPDPFAPKLGARMYRTGDRARWLADGRIEFGGRVDDQVKIRGFRVEPGEIESVLRALPGVEAAVVVAREDSGERRLVGYVVPEAGRSLDVRELSGELGKTLPEHMVPSAFVLLDALPLNANGKVDRKALPAPDYGSSAAEYVAPRDSTEARIAEVFAEVLGAARVGVHDDFFALGGHSLLATRAVSRLTRTLGRELSVRALFTHPTVARLADVVREARRADDDALVRVDRTQKQEASFAQARLWYLDQLEGPSAGYNVPLGFWLAGSVDADALEQALGALVARHEALRTTFVEVDGRAFQRIHAAMPPALVRLEVASEADARARAAEEAAKPFDLAKGPLMRASLVRHGEAAHLLVLSMHHIVADGVSTMILTRELSRLYDAFVRREPAPLAEPRIDYADFAAWERRRLSGARLAEQTTFWKQYLAGAPAALELPTDRPRPAQKQSRGASVPVVIPPETAVAVRAFCRNVGVTPFMVLLTAFQVLLSRWSGQKDVVVGTPSANRTREELEGLVGCFVNTLALRSTFEDDPTFAEGVARLKRSAVAAFSHQDLPFEKLVDELGVTRDTARTPVVQAMFSTGDADVTPVLQLDRVESRFELVGDPAAKFDLTMTIEDPTELTDASITFDVALFDRPTMERFAEHFANLLTAAVHAPDVRVGALPLMSDAERRTLLAEWNGTRRAVPSNRLVHEQFEDQVDRTPDALAVWADGTPVTYRDLDRQANRFAHLLDRLGLREHARAALVLDRSIEMLVAQLAVLKLGATYVALATNHPADRNAFIIEDSDAAVVITTTAETAKLRLGNVKVLAVDAPSFAEEIARQSDARLERRPHPRDAAYVIYTSGTTGKPKGTLIEHRAVVNMVAEHRRLTEMTSTDRVACIAAPAFDAAPKETWAALGVGAALFVVSEKLKTAPADLVPWMRKNGLTLANMPTALAEVTLDEDWRGSTLRVLSCGGQALRRRPDGRHPFRMLNVYGPTETTTFVTAETVAVADAPVTTIGGPIANARIYILDENLDLVPIGVPGEIVVGGLPPSRGYLNRPALTAEKFVPDPFAIETGARMYRTGDRGRWLSTGTVEYLGRIDKQVKLRGFRVELGEIETLLLACPGVGSAVVLAREDAPGDTRLVAYVVPLHGASIEIATLKSELARSLPDYMVPSAFVVLGAIPLTPNGKLDTKALPAPDYGAPEDVYVAPRDATEEALAAIFRDVLRIEEVGINDDFFALGGHSLLATRVVSRIRARLGLQLPVRALLEDGTVARLAVRVREAKRADDAAPSRVDRSKPIPASSAQTRLWFLDQLEGPSDTYNTWIVVRLAGRLDAAVLDRAIQELAQRHESLRTTYVDVEGVPHQRVGSYVPVPLTRFDAGTEHDARAWMASEFRRPFDLATGPMIRASLARIAEDEHLFALTMHHIATDGWSNGILLRELSQLYAAFLDGKPSPLAPPKLDYVDYAEWHRQWLSKARVTEQLAFWKKHLAGAPRSLELPTDRPRPANKQYRGDVVEIPIAPPTTAAVRALCQRTSATSFMVLLTAFQTLLSRWSGQADVVVGTPVANRSREELEGIVGLFINTLALRNTFERDTTFAGALERLKRDALAGFTHQDLPFERLVDELHLPPDTSRNPVFQAMFVMNNTSAAHVELPGLALTPEPIYADTAKFDVCLSIHEEGDVLHGILEFDEALFDRSTIERMARHFGALLDAALAAPDQAIARLPILADDERKQLLVDWNATAGTVDVTPVHASFERQARQTPDAIAVESEGARLTYRELDARANRLAHHLRALRVDTDSVVALCMERSVEVVVAMLGVLKAGGAYLPIDPAYPVDRIRYMLEDSGVPVLLTQARLRERLVGLSAVPTIALDDSWPTIATRSAESPGVVVPLASLAYVIYTSGSTGMPLGALLEHRNVANYLAWCQRAYPLDGGTGSPVHSSIAFDLTVTSLLAPLTTGRTVRLVPDAAGVEGLADLFAQASDLSLVKITPAHLKLLGEQLAERGTPASGRTRSFVIGGENLLPEHVDFWRRHAPDTKLINEYGPTETTVGCCVHVETAGEPGGTTLPIGRPILNTELYVLDPNLEPVPVGVIGELYIGGAQVGRGYRNRPDLTAERYIPHPFEPGARLYRSGDLARWRADGNLECLGRIDDQVKVRGHRIELGEVEVALARCEGVRACVVVARDDGHGGKILVGYAVPAPGGTLHAQALDAALRQTLPEYMIPSAFVILAELPLNANGKIDRKALPAPDFSAASAEYVAPRTPLETELADLFASVLRLDRVGIHDGFFALGGHSLLATQLMARVRSKFSADLPLRVLFEARTVAELAEQVRLASGLASLERIATADRSLPIPASFAQTRLFFLDQFEGPSATYNVPSVHRLRGALDSRVLGRALQELVARHEALRTTYAIVDGETRQIIDAHGSLELVRLDASSEEEAAALVAREIHAPFDLTNGPICRATLIRLSDGEHLFLLCIHHIATDAASNALLFRELSELYAAFLAGKSSPLPPTSLEYADFAVWERQTLTGESLAAEVAFWKEHLDGAPTALELPTDRPRPAIKKYRGGRLGRTLSRAAIDGVRELSRRSGATSFMVQLAAFQLVLARWSGQKDVVVGTPIANRTRQELETVVGFFTNTLALRTKLDGDPTFADVVGRVKEAALAAYAHQSLPFEKLVDELRVPRDTSRTPVFQAMFILVDEQLEERLSLGDAVAREEPRDFEVAKFDITLGVVERAHDCELGLDYDVELFDRETAERILTSFELLLTAGVTRPDTPASALPIMAPEEHDLVVRTWNATERQYPRVCAHQLLEARSTRSPDLTAVTDGSQSLSYAALNARANQIAHHLASLGIRRGARVGICASRSLDMVAAVLGVLKAGAAYLPLDASYPVDRLEFMVADAQPAAIVTEAQLRSLLPASPSMPVVLLDRDAPRIAERPVVNLDVAVHDSDACYVIYTSGSTGRPKGVVMPHRPLVNLIHWQEESTVRSGGVTLQFTPLSFDVSFQELFSTWHGGGTLVLIGEDDRRDPIRLLEKLEAQRVERLFLPFVALKNLALATAAGAKLPSALKCVVTAGEQLQVSPEIASMFERLDGCALHNHYGPSETHVVTAHELEGAPASWPRLPPIGKPIANATTYVLDERLVPVPIGVTGELFLGGDCVADGYLDRPELTAERFVLDPFASTPGARLYRTGDLARWRHDGTLEYLGRSDKQVKVRGYRIEPGEVEAAVAASPRVRSAAVVTRKDAIGEMQLVAYVVPAEGQPIDVDRLKADVRRTLPDYMVPSAFVVLEALPLTPSGKVDRGALPAPPVAARDALANAPPETAIEDLVADVFGQLLGLSAVGRYDDFFALGGHSILAMRVVNMLQGAGRRQLRVRDVFEAPTVAALAQRLATPTEGAGEMPPLARTGAPSGSVLAFVHELMVGFEANRKPSRIWTVVLRIDLRGPLERARLFEAVRATLDRQESLRQTFDKRVPGFAPRLCDAHDVPIEQLELGSESELERFVVQAGNTCFDVQGEPLVRFHLVRLGELQHSLVVTWHQSVNDPNAAPLFGDELAEHYRALGEERPARLPALPVRYTDYAAWERQWFVEGDGRHAVERVRGRLAGAKPLELADKKSDALVGPLAFEVEFKLDAEASGRFLAFCRSAAVTPFIALSAVVGVHLARWSGQDDVVFVSPVNLRNLVPEIAPVMGRCISLVPVRLSLSGKPTWSELLARAKQSVTAAFAEERTPAPLVFGVLDAYAHPLARVIFNMPSTAGTAPPSIRPFMPDALAIDVRAPRAAAGARGDLAIVMGVSDGQIEGYLRGAVDRFEQSTIEKQVALLVELLRTFGSDTQPL